jgi:hypothetical protein
MGNNARSFFYFPTHATLDPAVILDDFFTRDEVAALLTRAEAMEWHQARVNVGDGEEELDLEERRHMRTYLDDAKLAADVSSRLRTLAPHVPHDFVNPRFRVLKYVPGDYFRPHYDGEQEHMGGRSTHTLLIYLCDMTDGGATRFCETGMRVLPKAGRALLFKQEDYEHEGEPPISGVKLVMRTDLMVHANDD